VPDVSKNKDIKPLDLLDHGDERHIYAESYRSLRSAIVYLGMEGAAPKILLVTSAIPNEGKSTVSANLARTLAMGGSRVLLVDGDMRKGRLHEVLGFPAVPGLVEILQDPDKLASVIRQNSIPNLSFLSRGGPSHTPGDLFLGAGLNCLLERFRQLFDYVIIDSCPIFAADDSSTLAPKVDGTLFVVRSGYSHAKAVKEALEVLYKRHANIIGIVFNRANTSASGYYYYKYNEYYPPAKAVQPATNE
jgi:polysaccharide biosynthesis transport protein